MRRFTRPAVLFLAAVLAACGESGRVAYDTIIDREQFRAAEGRVAPAPVDSSSTTQLPPGEVIGPLDASEHILDIVAVPGPPPIAANDPGVVSDIAVDEVVGYVNGRPLRASDFFEADGMGTRLAQDAKKQPRDEWMRKMQEDIANAVSERIESDLLVAEATGSLSKEQRLGLFSWLETLQRDTVRQAGGSRTLAEQRVLQGAAESSLDEWVSNQKDTFLVRYWMETQIRPRVQVSLRDMRLFYEQNQSLFNPPAVAHFRVIDIKEARTEAIDRVRMSLAAGTPFAEVAASKDNQLDKDIRTADWTSTFDGPFEKAQHFSSGPLNEQVQALRPGAWVGPIVHQGVMRWVYLDRVDRRSIPFEDAQYWISERLEGMRTKQELQRYFADLSERAKISDPSVMINRLITIAVQRFNPLKPVEPPR